MAADFPPDPVLSPDLCEEASHTNYLELLRRGDVVVLRHRLTQEEISFEAHEVHLGFQDEIGFVCVDGQTSWANSQLRQAVWQDKASRRV